MSLILMPMTGIITLEDGSDIHASNLGLGGALESIGQSISHIDTQLSQWLLDVAQRPGGFMDFDLRGLDTTRRAAFWKGVEFASNGLADWNQREIHSPAAEVIRLFHERRGAEGASIEGRFSKIDLSDLWYQKKHC